MVSPPIYYPGGKYYQAKRIIAIMPKHKYYLEAFGGSGAVLFAKRPAGFEVYNDIDGSLVNLYRVLKDEQKFEKFCRLANLTLYSRGEYDYAVKNLDNGDDVGRALNFFIAIRQGFGGKIGSWGYTIKTRREKMSKMVSSWLSAVESLPEVHNRLRRVQIECGNWRKICNRYNEWGREGLYYLDPPYMPNTRSGGLYRYEFTEEDHKELIDWLLAECKVNVILNGYESELYKELERAGWSVRRYEVMISLEKKVNGNRQHKHEYIWYNYELPQVSML